MIDPIQPNDDAFVDQLRSMKPIFVPNVQETFYRTGWEAAMLQQSNAHSLAPLITKHRFNFSWGLISGLATGVVLMLSIQSIGFVWNSDQKVHGMTSIVVDKNEPYKTESHHAFKSSMAAVPNDLTNEFPNRLFAAPDLTGHAQSIIQQRKELLNELSGSLRRNRVSKLAMHYSEPTPIDIGPESNASLRNALFDQEMQQLLKSGKQSFSVN